MKKTLATNCVQKIKDLIIFGDLLPGEHIKGEYLRSKLGVGLSPIREALSFLSAGFLVDFIDNVGFKVASMDKDKVRSIYFAYAKLDSVMLESAISDGDDNWECLVIGALHRLSKLEEHNELIAYELWKKSNDEFHDILVSGCNNIFLQQSRLNFLDFRNWVQNLAKAHLPQANHKHKNFEHDRVARLAVSRNIKEASSLLFKHNIKELDRVLIELKRQAHWS